MRERQVQTDCRWCVETQFPDVPPWLLLVAPGRPSAGGDAPNREWVRSATTSLERSRDIACL